MKKSKRQKFQPDKKMLKYILIAAGFALLMNIYYSAKGVMENGFLHYIYYFALAMFTVCVLNPRSSCHERYLADDLRTKAAILTVICAVSLLVYIPMGWNPIWNGEIPDHRDQYEEMTDAILDGHIDLHYHEDVSGLSALSNPYDPGQRDAAGVTYNWDHAFYNGRYYMYFGIVPVIFPMLPYQLITGSNLITWQVTGIFAVLAVIALFAVGAEIIKYCQSKCPLTVYLTVCSSLSFAMLWYAILHPALYCTAITSGICFALWSFFLIFKAFMTEPIPKIRLLLPGALFGALVFGCRPPIGLFEVVYIPLLIHYYKKCAKTGKIKQFLRSALCFAIPYVAVAIALMAYNYARFDNVFEFGQSYQLTLADQSGYSGGILERFSLTKLINQIIQYFLTSNTLTDTFPWIRSDIGLMYMCPLLLYGIFRWNRNGSKVIRNIRIFLILGALLIVESQVLNSPFPIIRYRIDFTFVLALGAMFCIFECFGDPSGTTDARTEQPASPRVRTAAILFSVYGLLICFLLTFTSCETSLVDVGSTADLVNTLSRFFLYKDIM